MLYYCTILRMDRVKIGVTKKEAHKVWDNWRRNNRDIYRSLRKMCLFCESKQFLCLHHKDGDKRNNKIDNLMCLCTSCHFNLHSNFKIYYNKEDIQVVHSVQKLKDELNEFLNSN